MTPDQWTARAFVIGPNEWITATGATPEEAERNLRASGYPKTALQVYRTRAMSGWQPIETASKFQKNMPLLCRNASHWPEICYLRGGMAFDRRGYALVGFVVTEWNADVGYLNWSNSPHSEPPK